MIASKFVHYKQFTIEYNYSLKCLESNVSRYLRFTTYQYKSKNNLVIMHYHDETGVIIVKTNFLHHDARRFQ